MLNYLTCYVRLISAYIFSYFSLQYWSSVAKLSAPPAGAANDAAVVFVRQGKEGGPVREGSRSGRYGGGGGCTYGTDSWELSYSWKEGTQVLYRQNGGAVLLVNVFVKLSLQAPTRDRALIVYRLLVQLSL